MTRSGRIESLDSVGPAEIAELATRDDLQVFWKTNGLTIAGLGIADSRSIDAADSVDDLLSSLQTHAGRLVQHATMPGPWFGGMAFDPGVRSDPLWRGFPASRWILPRTLYWSTGERAWRATFQEQIHRETPAVESRGVVSAAAPLPGVGYGASEFRAKVDRVLDVIARGDLDKLVVSLGIDVPLSASFSPMVALRALPPVPGVTQFLFRGTDDSWLMGASPETLLVLHGNQVTCDALGGSVALGGTYSDKERAEHQFVVDAIVQALQPLAHGVESSPTRSWDLPYISHLHTVVRATGVARSSLSPLVSALHPTPAVCGWPTSVAQDLLRGDEAAHRGWYAGLVGCLGQDRAHLLVCLRCALVRPLGARIFVGAGVVDGSSSASEFVETQAKAEVMRSVLSNGSSP